MINLIGLILCVCVVIFVGFIAASMDEKLAAKYGKPAVLDKACPPHQWRWEDQPGMEKQTYFIRCQRCKKLPGFDIEQKE